MQQKLVTLWNLWCELPRQLRILNLAVMIILGSNFVITYRLYNNISTQQKLINASYLPIRNITHLQHAHLQLAALMENGDRHFNRREFFEQIDLVGIELQNVVAPPQILGAPDVKMPEEYQKLLQTLTNRWRNIRPILTRWGEKPSNKNLRQILLEYSNAQDSMLRHLNQIAEVSYQNQLSDNEISTRTMLQQLIITSLIWTVLLGLFTMSIAGFIRDQRKNEAELMQAKEAADAASDAKSAFLSNMSHEMRTPMNAIMGLTALALNDAESPPQREQLQLVKDSSEHLLLLIDEVLNISKVETGEVVLQKKPFAPRTLVAEIIALFAEEARTKRIELSSHVNIDVPQTVIGDKQHLCQVLLNVVENALKFSNEGTVTISVSAHPTTSAQAAETAEATLADGEAEQPITLIWTVQDSGVGIPAEKHDSIFEAFHQADNSSTREYGGTGLGLTLCKKLLELMDGDILLESELHQGSTFTIKTPLTVSATIPQSASVEPKYTVQEQITVQEQTADIASAVPTQPTHLADYADSTTAPLWKIEPNPISTNPISTNHRNLSTDEPQTHDPQYEIDKTTTNPRILIVEDTPVNQKLVSLILKRAGYHFELAQSGVEAVQKYNEAEQIGSQFDLILMDLHMPEMNGLDATKAIRAKESGSAQHTPIIALTANAVSGTREECFQAGMDEYLTKPLNADMLLTIIQNFATAVPPKSELRT